MMNQPPPELFAEPPVRSNFGRRPPQRKLSRAALLAGGGLLLLLAVGAGFLFSGSSTETSSDDVPTITAESPIKQRPDQPGGIDIPHQDVTVFQKLEKGNEEQKDSKPVEHLLPQHEVPDLATETTSSMMPPLDEAAQKRAVQGTVQGAPVMTESVAPIASTEEMAKDIADSQLGGEGAAQTALTDAMTKAPPVTTTVKEEAAKKTVEPVKKQEPAKKIEAPVVKAIKKEAELAKVAKPAAPSNLPKEMFTGDPDSITQMAKAAVKDSASAPVKKESAVASGNYVIQMASVPDHDKANGMMEKLSSQFSSALKGTRLRLVKADIAGKGTYYRIQSQSVAEDAARSMCASVKSSGGSCIVVKP